MHKIKVNNKIYIKYILLSQGKYPNYPKYWVRQAWANNADPDQMLHNVASDQGLHCFPYIHIKR